MKRKFRMLMSFLRTRKDKIYISWSAPDSNPELQWPHMSNSMVLPQNILDILVEITDSKVDEIFNIDCYSETDYYVLNAEIDPKEKKIVYFMFFVLSTSKPISSSISSNMAKRLTPITF